MEQEHAGTLGVVTSRGVGDLVRGDVGADENGLLMVDFDMGAGEFGATSAN